MMFQKPVIILFKFVKTDFTENVSGLLISIVIPAIRNDPYMALIITMSSGAYAPRKNQPAE
jgi:hypothetical protein